MTINAIICVLREDSEQQRHHLSITNLHRPHSTVTHWLNEHKTGTSDQTIRVPRMISIGRIYIICSMTFCFSFEVLRN